MSTDTSSAPRSNTTTPGEDDGVTNNINNNNDNKNESKYVSNNNSNNNNTAVKISEELQDGEQDETHLHPHASSPDARSDQHNNNTGEQQPTKDDEKKVKHIWEGQDIWLPEKDSYFYCVNRPVWLNTILAFVMIACGMFEGFLFVHVNVVNPLAITEQFRFRVWIVMKIFLAVVGCSMFVQALFDFVSPSFFAQTRGSRYISHGWWRVIAAGAFVGLGTVLSGSGPTVVPAQLGSNVGHSWVTLLGFIAGGFLVPIVDKLWLHKHKRQVNEHKDEDKLTIDETLGIRYWKLALPMGIFMIAMAMVLEFVITPTGTEADARDLGANIGFTWPAVAAGAWVGLNQLTFRLIAHSGEGGSTSVLVFISFITWGKLAEKNFPNSFPRIWQFIYVWIGIPLGAVIANKTSGGSFIEPGGLNPLRSFFGGLFTVIGSKMFGVGCICGASMTGTSELGLEQFVQTIAVFAVGIPFAFILNAAGAPDAPYEY